MALNPIAAGLRNPTVRNIKVQLSIPAGASLDDVADQLLAAGLRAAPARPETSAIDDEGGADDGADAIDEERPKRRRKADG